MISTLKQQFSKHGTTLYFIVKQKIRHSPKPSNYPTTPRNNKTKTAGPNINEPSSPKLESKGNDSFDKHIQKKGQKKRPTEADLGKPSPGTQIKKGTFTSTKN